MFSTAKNVLFLCFAVGLFIPSGYAHIDGMASVHDTVVEIKRRLIKEFNPDELVELNRDTIMEFITDDEKRVLSEGHIRMSVNVPVNVIVLKDPGLGEDPFWLKSRGFEPAGIQIEFGGDEYEGWKTQMDAGRIGFGVNSLRGGGEHYLIALSPQNPEDRLEISKPYPGQCRIQTAKEVEVYVQRWDGSFSLPDALQETTIVMAGSGDWEDNANLTRTFRKTRFPAKTMPDQIVLTWSDDPKTTQTVQWRTSKEVTTGKVKYIKKSEYNRFNPSEPKMVNARSEELETLDIVNDPLCFRHYATITGLEPDTTYLYSVGDADGKYWSGMAEFTTAPDRVKPFSFVYLGDAQNGLDRWGTLVHNAFRHRPDADFYVMVGDLVNVGNERWDWDDFFYNADGVYNNRQLVPAIGNHEDQGPGPWMYLRMFDLPKNGPENIEAERAYSFEYSNALFVILDTNLEPEDQTEWLEEQLKNSDALWKFVVYHHPAYSSSPNRNNPEVREHWVPLFDKYKVDMCLQGHDHAYLRTYPMKGGEPQKDGGDGTIYIVSVSGTKMYEQGDFDYKEFGMTNVSTYQTLDIQLIGDRMIYRSYDILGNLRDDFIIEKSDWRGNAK